MRNGVRAYQLNKGDARPAETSTSRVFWGITLFANIMD